MKTKRNKRHLKKHIKIALKEVGFLDHLKDN